jgi:hypothetical protein
MTINTELIEKLFEDSNTKLKEEYQIFISKVKDYLSKSRQQTLYKIKKI